MAFGTRTGRNAPATGGGRFPRSTPRTPATGAGRFPRSTPRTPATGGGRFTRSTPRTPATGAGRFTRSTPRTPAPGAGRFPRSTPTPRRTAAGRGLRRRRQPEPSGFKKLIGAVLPAATAKKAAPRSKKGKAGGFALAAAAAGMAFKNRDKLGRNRSSRSDEPAGDRV